MRVESIALHIVMGEAFSLSGNIYIMERITARLGRKLVYYSYRLFNLYKREINNLGSIRKEVLNTIADINSGSEI